MTLGDTVQLALRNLGQAKLRTTLTTLGVSIGIASLAGMVSLGVGLQEQFVGRFLKSGMFDSVTVTSGGRGLGPLAAIGRRGGAGGRGFGAGRGGNAVPDKAPPPLDDAALQQMAALPQVRDVYPNLRVPVEITYVQFSEVATATGVPMSSRDEGAFQTMTFGTFFKNDTDNACVISLDFAKRVASDGDPKDLIGKDLILTYATSAAPGSAAAVQVPGTPFQLQRIDAKYTIVGVVERDPAAGLGALAGLSNLMIPLSKAKAIGAVQVTNAQSMLRGPGERSTYNSVTVKVAHAQFTQDVEDQIKAMGYSAFSLNDALQSAKRAFIILDIVLSLIGSIALAVSSLGIVNTMVMSILERTREIGVMKAVGGSDGDIRRIFLIEASTIGVLGGVLGVALGWAFGRVIDFGANIYIRSQGGTVGNLFSLPWWLIGGSIGFAVIVSLIAGSYPASRAAKLDPIQALRHD